MTILATLACTVSAAGISRPLYADILQTLQSKFQSIYGSDAYIDPDSQDGQLLAVVAKAIDDSNATAVAVYNSYSPATAQGVALSNGVKLNGIARAVPSNSQVVLRVTGTVGTTIVDGIANDANGQQWLLPASVTIPVAGFIDVTATASSAGAIAAEIGTVTQIFTPQLGWQLVTNLSAASLGAPVESDATLRQRQGASVALPSLTVLDGILGAVEAVTGVTQVKIYENDTDAVDVNGLPAHSISAVVVGGAAADIASAVLLKKSPGCNTYGTTAVSAVDPQGIPYTISYFVAGATPISAGVTIKALSGYTAAIGTALKQSIADYINGLGIGKHVDIGKLYLPAQFFGGANSAFYELDGLIIAAIPAAQAAADVPIAFNNRATCSVADITLTVT